MVGSRKWSGLALAMLVLATGLGGTPHAQAKGNHLYSSEANARSVCGKDKVVWANIDKPEYYRPGSANYAKGKGAYTCEHSAKAHGWQLAE